MNSVIHYVAFCAQMILAAGATGQESVFGIRFPAKYATHAELVLVHLLMPHAPLLTNLSGMATCENII